MTYDEWARKYPEAAADLYAIGAQEPEHQGAPACSEARAQQRIRWSAAEQNALMFRNNVGATPAKCEKCGHRMRVVRYGLANESTLQNERVKSADLIGIAPRVIRPDHVGRVIGQFVSIEAKKSHWMFKGTERERAQNNWGNLITSRGGMACFSTGTVDLSW